MSSPPNTHMLSMCFWIVFGDRFDIAKCSRNGRTTSRADCRAQIFLQAHPRAWPTVQIPAVVFEPIARRSGGTGYFGSFRRRHLLLHAAAHHNSKSVPPVSGIRLPEILKRCANPALPPQHATIPTQLIKRESASPVTGQARSAIHAPEKFLSRGETN